jgi:esterase
MQLHFQVRGDGPPLIILHGFLGSSDNWQTVSRRLSDTFRVFTIDLRNHGRSPHSHQMDYETMSSDLFEFVQQHTVPSSSSFFLGHSMGGKIAMQLATDHVESVAKLIVVDIAPRDYEPSHRPLLNTLRRLDLDRYGSFTEIDQALAASITSPVMRQFLLKNLTYDKNRRFAWRIDLEAIARNYDHLRMRITPRQSFIKPALFIRGGRSNYIMDSDISLIYKIFPAAEVKTIVRAGHWVHADAPEEFLQIVLTFLTET